MSFVQPSTVHAIAQSLEVGAVSDEAAKALSPDVEYRLREVVQVTSYCLLPSTRQKIGHRKRNNLRHDTHRKHKSL